MKYYIGPVSISTNAIVVLRLRLRRFWHQIEDCYFGAAIDSNSTEAADASCDVDLPIVPKFKTSDESLVFHGDKMRSHYRHQHLTSVSVSAQHQIPFGVAYVILRIRVVR
jgi:hypothetical protein